MNDAGFAPETPFLRNVNSRDVILLGNDVSLVISVFMMLVCVNIKVQSIRNDANIVITAKSSIYPSKTA